MTISLTDKLPYYFFLLLWQFFDILMKMFDFKTEFLSEFVKNENQLTRSERILVRRRLGIKSKLGRFVEKKSLEQKIPNRGSIKI